MNSAPELPPLFFTPLADRLKWTANDVRRYASQAAMACAEARRPLTDPVFELTPEGKTADVAYLRSCDVSWWRRRATRALRIAQEVAELRAGVIGASGSHRYAGPSSAVWSEHKRRATQLFLGSTVLYDHASGTAVPLASVVKSDAERAARAYSFLVGIERQAALQGLRWAMLTVTLPAEYHPCPANCSKVAWNGVTADKAHKEIADAFQLFRSQLAKHNIVLTGVRTEEPMQDTTPHWHIAFFYRDTAQLHHIQRAILRQWPAGLRVRSSLRWKASGKLRFRIKQYASLADYDAGVFHRNARVGAQCQLDLGAQKLGDEFDESICTFASYVLKYVSKSLGVETGSGDSADALVQAGPAASVRLHRETYGINQLRFFGLPVGIMDAWDQLRQVRLADDDGQPLPVPPCIARLAAIVQQDKGQGIHEYLSLVGGIRIAPIPPVFKLRALKVDTVTKHGASSSKKVGIQLVDNTTGRVEAHVLRDSTRSILSVSAAEAISTALELDELNTCAVLGEGATAEGRGLVKIGTSITSQESQEVAIRADINTSHTVIAAAGSGKTHVLLERAAFLAARGIPQQLIVLATFTRESAEVMRRRLASRNLPGVQVGTMHALSGRWLGAHGVRVKGYDEAIQRAAEFGRREYYVLLDEAQDLSPDQWTWAAANGRTVFAVGDDRQAIYSWRGAASNALRAQALLTGVQRDFFREGGLIDLPVNRRSSSLVVALGNALQPTATPAMSLRSGGSIERIKVERSADEHAALIEWCARTTGSRAILTRTNAEAAFIMGRLRLLGFDVPVMTIHAAKGLEFDHVALSFGVRKPSEESEDAAQTMYVAVTRARESLFCTAVGQFPSLLSAAVVDCVGVPL